MASRGLWHFMGARTRRGLALSWSALFVLSLLLQYFSFALASPIAAAVGTNLFELDGNAVDDSGAALPDDWDKVKAGTSGADSALFITDGFNQNDDIFTGGGSKDVSSISSWAWKSASVQDKDDIEHAFAAAYTQSGNTFVYFGLDRYQTSGDATAGFWFLKSSVGKAANGSFTGAHVEGDVLVVLDFSNGGAVASAQIYTWHNGALTAGASGTKCDGSVQTVCAISNTAVATAPWPYDDKGAAGAVNDFPANGLFEGGINLSALKLDTGCFSTFIAETRSSNSETATLSDLALGSFSLCAPAQISTQVKKDGQSTGDNGHITIGQAVTDTATITGTKGTATGTVDFFQCFSATSTPDCTSGGAKVGATKTLASGSATSDALTPIAVGQYCFRVEYTPATGSKYLPGTHTNTTSECFVVDKKPTSISTAADQTVGIGAAISDTATLAGATADASGSIVFKAYGPNDDTCSKAAAFTSQSVAVTGPGDYGPASFTPATAGSYRWIATYSGDAKNLGSAGACTDPGEHDVVNQATPTIATVASASVAAGGQIHDTASVSGGANPTGTVTFKLYGPNDATCANPAVFTSGPIALSNGSATSGNFTTTMVGTYRWRATYNGDANNVSVSGACNAANESVVVIPASPSIQTILDGGNGNTGAHITVALGTSVHDTSSLTGATADAGGTVHYRVFTDATCQTLMSGGDAGTVPVVNGAPGNSIGIVFSHAGIYYWQADYSGDANNNAASSNCTSETVTLDKAIPHISTQASADVTVGGKIHDVATLTSGFNPTGTITFTVYGPNDATCQNGTVVLPSATVTGNKDYTSGDYTATTAGTYRWIASYSGDGDNAAAVGSCNDANESVVVSPVTPAISTQASADVTVGGKIHDVATLTSGFNPTGTITFTVYGPNDATCQNGTVVLPSATVTGNKDYTSGDYTATTAGTYRWIASYSGDANNGGVSGKCNDANESVVVKPATPAITTQASAPVTVGGVINDTAHLTGTVNGTGHISFTVFQPGDTSCANGTAVNPSVVVAGDGFYASANYTTTKAGTYRWIASYDGDTNNTTVTGKCNDANESVVVNPAAPELGTSATVGAQVGDKIHDVATLSGGFTPTGTITFKLYGPADPNCTGADLLGSGPVQLSNGSATSPAYTVTLKGDYHWIASYSGDANNIAAAGFCGEQGETTVVTQFAPSISTTLSSGNLSSPKITVLFGSSVRDQATLTGASATAGGTVTYTVFSDAACKTFFADGGTKNVTNGVVGQSDPVLFASAGTYYWLASYSGDDANSPAVSACGDEVVTVTTPNLHAVKLVKTNAGSFGPTSTANPGDKLTFQITVTNSGNADATNVPVSDDIAAILAHATYNADCNLGCGFAASTLAWTIPTIAANGGSVTLTFSVTLDDSFPAGTTHLPNVVVVTGPGSNCEAASKDADCDTDTTVEAQPALNAEKLVAVNDGGYAHSGSAQPGDTLNYKITITNTGNADATNVPVSDDIAAVLAHATYNADCNLGCNFAAGTLTWTIPTIAANGGSVTLTFSVTLDDSFPTGTTDLPNVVVVTGPGSNCQPNNEVQDANCVADTTVTTSLLTIDKSFTGNTNGTDPDLNVPSANIGDTLHYTLHYTGAGPIADAVITDVLPQGLDYVVGSAAGDANFTFDSYNPASRTLRWLAVEGLPNPADGAVTYDLKVLTTAPGFAQPLINLATIVGHTPTGSELTDHDTASVAVLAPPKELTPPPTSTITPQTGTSNPGFALMLLLLGVAGLTLGIGFITPAPARVRRRNRLG